MKSIIIIILLGAGAIFGGTASAQSIIKKESVSQNNHDHHGRGEGKHHHRRFRIFHFGRHHHHHKHDNSKNKDCKKNQQETPATTGK